MPSLADRFRSTLAPQDYQQRVAEEMAVRRKKEQELHAMAKVELQLIERLKKKQQEQVQAYTEVREGASCPRMCRAATFCQAC